MKRMTRKQVTGLLLPIRSALKEMLSGEVDAIRGYAVTRLHHGDEYERVDFCLAGFSGVLGRIFPALDLSPLTRLQKRLAAGAPVTEADIHRKAREAPPFRTGRDRAARVACHVVAFRIVTP